MWNIYLNLMEVSTEWKYDVDAVPGRRQKEIPSTKWQQSWKVGISGPEDPNELIDAIQVDFDWIKSWYFPCSVDCNGIDKRKNRTRGEPGGESVGGRKGRRKRKRGKEREREGKRKRERGTEKEEERKKDRVETKQKKNKSSWQKILSWWGREGWKKRGERKRETERLSLAKTPESGFDATRLSAEESKSCNRQAAGGAAPAAGGAVAVAGAAVAVAGAAAAAAAAAAGVTAAAAAAAAAAGPAPRGWREDR